MTTFTFNKLWYPLDELLEIIPIKRTTLYEFHRSEIEEGRDGSEMGKVKIKGMRKISTHNNEKETTKCLNTIGKTTMIGLI